MDNMIIIEPNTDSEFKAIKYIASTVWPVAYGAILSQDQLDYMMDMMYSRTALFHQVHELKHHFIVAKNKEEVIGFASYELHYEGASAIKIHKLYILTDQQGKGVGKLLVDYIAQEAVKQEQESLLLNVNRNNTALGFYEKLGFQIQSTVNIPIGNGYLMEDYIMIKKL
jgi:ribosomal protein S18 acetylase RimI-like enzyme